MIQIAVKEDENSLIRSKIMKHDVEINDYMNKVMQALEKEENCTKWFYSSDVALGNKSPYELCKEGKKSELYKILDLIEHEVFDPDF